MNRRRLLTGSGAVALFSEFPGRVLAALFGSAARVEADINAVTANGAEQTLRAVQKSGDISDPRARGSYLKSGFVDELTSMIDVLVDGFQPHPGRGIFVGFQHSGGAIGRVASDATAFAHRDVRHDSLCVTHWAMGDDPTEHIRYLREYFAAYAPYTIGFYTNDVSLNDSQQAFNRNYADIRPACRTQEALRLHEPVPAECQHCPGWLN